MANKKHQVVDTLTHEHTGTKIPIKLNPETYMFYADHTILGITIQHQDGKALKESIFKHLKEVSVAEWEPVIRVYHPNGKKPYGTHYSAEDGFGAQSYLIIERFWIARRKSGLKPLEWDHWTYTHAHTGEDLRNTCNDELHWDRDWGTLGELPFHQPDKGNYSGKTFSIYPYSDELWEQLKGVVEQVEVMYSSIRDILINNVFSLLPSSHTTPEQE